jgi:HSP20 family protein
MNLIPWKNKRESRQGELSPLVSLRSEMDRLFDTFLSDPFGALDWPHWGAGKWSPAIEVAEGEKEVSVRAELPGIDPKDIDVTVVGNELILSGEKRESSETKDKGVYHSETRYGSFRRTVPLPENVDTEHVEAEFANGVLTLRLPKTAPVNLKRIEVKVK